MKPMVIQQFLTFARALAIAAEEPILRLYQNCSVGIKEDGTEVTDADRDAERVMREKILSVYPTHDVLGEEYGRSEKSESEFRWVLDPIDGTASFVLGSPMFGTLVALLQNDEPIVGVIHLPAMRETIYAAKGLGCWRESGGGSPARVHVAPAVELQDAVISATGVQHTDMMPGKTAFSLSRVIRGARKFRFVGDCVQYALVCKGTLHAAFDPMMHPWDIAAIVPCIEEAGGVVTSITGCRTGIVFGGSLLASCDPVLHNKLAGLLSPSMHDKAGTQPSEEASVL